ncbi:hypothetical protein L2E82_15277 [Cichorium intybus]|uniref:Uncharacterized protein n=1 Tax=Cichorium intybus TaxID=13427 RepID=A0ACB9F2D1_CICIN|nr:hypothetical protein L2E82_15277 [Cichorium intybus]
MLGGGKWCKAFNQFSNDIEILKVINFDDMEEHYFNESFWNDNGLLTRCASLGNEGAYQVIQQLPLLLLGMGGM